MKIWRNSQGFFLNDTQMGRFFQKLRDSWTQWDPGVLVKHTTSWHWHRSPWWSLFFARNINHGLQQHKFGYPFRDHKIGSHDKNSHHFEWHPNCCTKWASIRYYCKVIGPFPVIGPFRVIGPFIAHGHHYLQKPTSRNDWVTKSPLGRWVAQHRKVQ